LDSGTAMTLYIVISLVISLVVNSIFYKSVFKKQKRVKANTFAWLTTLGIMLIVNIVLIFPFTTNIDTGDGIGGVGSAIGFGLAMTFIIPPMFWFFPASGYSLIRMIYILFTRKREREILQDDIIDTELHVDAAYAAKETE